MLGPADGVDSSPGDIAELEHTGEYLEIAPYRRIGFTWISPYTGPEPSQVTIDFEDADAGTRLTLRHERLPAAVVDSHRGGWGSILDNLARVVEER